MRGSKVWKLSVPVTGLLGLFLAAGCASNGDGKRAETTQLGLTDGMYCPKCETVWVTRPGGPASKGMATMQSERKMKCPTCDSTAASHLMGDGKVMLHECPECKATPVMMKATP